MLNNNNNFLIIHIVNKIFMQNHFNLRLMFIVKQISKIQIKVILILIQKYQIHRINPYILIRI